MDKELQKLINEYMPKRYYGHEARRHAGVIAKLYAEQQLKNCNLQNVSNNEVAVCDHPDEAIIMDGDMDYCMACSTRIPKQTDC